eukprot:m.427803 g.427803  ORF g.427803 m.427803 type:complete len:124 (-) comp21366_c0_seq2:1185-1556(-)
MPKFPPLPQLLESSTNMPSVSGSTATNGRLNLDGFPMRGPPGAAPPTAPAHATHSARDFGTILAAAEGMTPQALQQLQQQHLQPTTVRGTHPPHTHTRYTSTHRTHTLHTPHVPIVYTHARHT